MKGNTMSDPWPSIEANKNKPAPYGWIQWKGTDVCMDIHCACGETMHVDADFLYYIECPYCGAVYECSGYIDLYPVEKSVAHNPYLLDRDD